MEQLFLNRVAVALAVALAVVSFIAIMLIVKNRRIVEKLELLLEERLSLLLPHQTISLQEDFNNSVRNLGNMNLSVPNYALWLKRRMKVSINSEICSERRLVGVETLLSEQNPYLVIPRSVLQSASPTTQDRLVQDLTDVKKEVGDWEKERGYYTVRYKTSSNQFAKDDLKNFDKGLRRIDLNRRVCQ